MIVSTANLTGTYKTCVLNSTRVRCGAPLADAGLISSKTIFGLLSSRVVFNSRIAKHRISYRLLCNRWCRKAACVLQSRTKPCSAWLAHRFCDVAQARNGLASMFYTFAYVNLLATTYIKQDSIIYVWGSIVSVHIHIWLLAAQMNCS